MKTLQFCSNCIGGLIYHRLGCEFLSPTINLFFTQPDFVNFLLHLDEYLALELAFVETSEPYPVAHMGGGSIPEIQINFVHYHSCEEARQKWNERKKRINRDNLYIIMFNSQGVTEEELHLLDNYRCNNKVLFNWKDMPSIPWSAFVKTGRRNDYLARNILGLRCHEKNWDFISFLNHQS